MIICKDWAETKDKAKSLEHIIQKCDPPTPAMPLVTTGAALPGLYSHSHTLLIKRKQKYPHLLRVQNQSKPEVQVKPQGHRQNPPKDQEADESYTYDNTNNYYHNDNYTAQVRVKATDLLMVKAVANNFEASYSKAEARDLSIIHINFRTTGLREVHIRVTAINTVATTNPTSRVIN